MRIGVTYGSSPVMRSYISNRLPYLASTVVAAQPRDRVGEVEVDAEPAGPDAAALVADVLRGARGDVARDEVAERRVVRARGSSRARPRGCRPGARSSPPTFGTQTRPSLRSDSLIRVSFDWWSPD